MNTHAGIIISTTIVCAALVGWTWWYLVPLSYALGTTLIPVHTDLRKELLQLTVDIKKLEIEKHKIELERLRKKR